MPGVSDNAGGVSYISTTLLHALKEERAISLSLKMCRSNQSSLVINIQVWNAVRPMHLFGHTFDHDTSSNSSVKRSGLPIHLLGVLLHTIACSELARVRTELFDCS